MGGIYAGIVAADPQTYRSFADGSFWPWVTSAWHDVVMATPYTWFLLLAAGEVALGCLLLGGGRAARWGWAGVLAFQVLLMTFGFGFWLWSVPALTFLIPSARADWSHLVTPRGSRRRRVLVSTPAQPRPMISSAPVVDGSPSAWTMVPLAVLVVTSSLYGLLASNPYRGLPEATVTGARAQDSVSILVALMLAVLALRRRTGAAARLVVLGLLGYLAYSYLIYVSGVPMNRMFLAYVAIVALAGAGLVRRTRSVALRSTRKASTALPIPSSGST